MKKYQKLADKYFEAGAELADACIKYLQKVLKKHNNELDCSNADFMITVVYDGGNHPEYASNAFSNVHSIFMDEYKDIYLNIDDCSEYSITYITALELYYICHFIDEQILPKLK